MSDVATEEKPLSLSAYMDMREAPIVPVPAVVDLPEEAPAVETEAEVEAPAVTPPEVSDAARLLAARKTESPSDKRKREIAEQIGRETARKHAAKTEADAEETRLARLRAEIAQLTAAPKPATAVTPPPAAAVAKERPVAPNFELLGSDEIPDWPTYQRKQDEYQTALNEWTLAEVDRKVSQQVDARLASARQKEVSEQADRAHFERMTASKEKHADFEAVVGDPTLPISDELFERHIKHSPEGPEVAYYLGTHRDEAVRIFRLDPFAQAREFGRLSALVSASPVAAVLPVPAPTPVVPVSQTPRPISPVGGAPTSAQVPTDRKTLGQYIAERDADEKRKGRP